MAGTISGPSLGGMNDDARIVEISGTIEGVNYKQVTCKEVTASESLLTPGLQTSAVFQSQIYNQTPFKDWDQTKGKIMSVNMKDKLGNKMKIAQTIYRLDNREFVALNIGAAEEMTFHATDVSLLKDAKTLVSKSWKCTKPDEIVNYVLSTCLGVQDADIQSSDLGRDYVADSIHPFQVIQQQANIALDGEDPSFVHYMTYGDGFTPDPKHHFRSLKSLTARPSRYTYYHTDSGVRGRTDYNHQNSADQQEGYAIHFSFPCDFDLLSDLLNGIDENGQNINAGSFINVADATGAFLNGNQSGCITNGNLKVSLTNKGTATQQNGCETNVEKYLLRRQARMGLLEKDKVTLRLIAPWNPYLHAGDVLTFKWFDKTDARQELYGSGDYLIVALTHRIFAGGYATTTFDCVAATVGQGKIDHQ